jgi:chaperonin GroES
MAIRPLQDRVIVKRVKEEEKTKGGIIIPDTAKEKPIEGEVIAVGNGKVLEDGTVRKLDVKAGDRVLFGKYSGTEVKIDGEEHLILREDDILGVIEGANKLAPPSPQPFAPGRETPWQPKRSSTPKSLAT